MFRLLAKLAPSCSLCLMVIWWSRSVTSCGGWIPSVAFCSRTVDQIPTTRWQPATTACWTMLVSCVVQSSLVNVSGTQRDDYRCPSHTRVSTDAALCGFQGCKNSACSVSWLEVVKGVPNQGVVFLSKLGQFFSVFCVSGVCSVLFPCFWLSVPVQSIAWKDSPLKWPIMCWVGR